MVNSSRNLRGQMAEPDNPCENQITSRNYLHDVQSIALENEMICPPPPPVPYGTLRYNSFADRLESTPNILEKSNTPSSNVESSGEYSISSNSSVLATTQTENKRQNFNLSELVTNTNSNQKSPATNLVYNHMFKSKFSTPNSTSCTTTWNGDVHLHESPTANSSSSSSYLPPVSKEIHEGNNMDSGL